MKPKPQTLRSADPSRDRYKAEETAKQAEEKAYPLVDKFLDALTKEERGFLRHRLTGTSEGSVSEPQGVFIDPKKIKRFMEELQANGISLATDVLNKLLFDRMFCFDDTQVQRNLVQQSHQPKGVIDQLLEEEITSHRRETIRICAGLKDGADMKQVAREERIPLKSLQDAQAAIISLAKKTGAQEDIVKRAILQRFQILNHAPESSPVQDDSVTLRKVRLVDGSLDSEATNAEFIGSLTDEGREMVKELFLLEDMRDADAIKKLQERTGKSGYIKLATNIVIRLNASPLAKREMYEAIKAIDLKEERKPGFVRPRDPDKITKSPWMSGRPVEGAKRPALTLPQILAEFTDAEKRTLLNELQQSETNFDGKRPVSFPMLVRCTQRMLANGLEPERHAGQLKLLLEGKSPTGSGDGAPFARPRKPGRKLTYSPWREQVIGPVLLPEIGPFYEKIVEEGGQKLLDAVVSTVNPKDPEEVWQMIQECAPGCTRGQFDQMNDRVILFVKRLGRPLEDIQQALRLKLDNAKVLPEGRPGMTSTEARRAPTVLSSDKQKGIIDRLLRKKGKPKKEV